MTPSLNRSELGSERLTPGGLSGLSAGTIKIMQDGGCENFTASMLTPYLDGHGHEVVSCGESFFAPGELAESVTAIDARLPRPFVVLDRNLFAHPAEEIALANVDTTIVGGQIMHQRAA